MNRRTAFMLTSVAIIGYAIAGFPEIGFAPAWGCLGDDGFCGGEASEISGLLDSVIFGVGELLDKIDDGPPKLCVWYLHECLGELEAIRGNENRYIL
jgi:hypothetical protein